MKPTKFAIAAVVRNPENRLEVLAVLRPPNDDSLPNVWGLPAVVVKEGELPEVAVKRRGDEKLATEIKAASYVGIKRIEREEFELILMDIEAELTGTSPSVVSATTTGTKYVEQLWVSDYTIFKEAAAKGVFVYKNLLGVTGNRLGLVSCKAINRHQILSAPTLYS